MRLSVRMLAALAGVLIVAAGCSSSSKSGATTGTAAPSSTTAPSAPSPPSAQPSYTIGVLTDLTGLLSSGQHTSPLGVKAGLGMADANGYKIKYIVADTASSP